MHLAVHIRQAGLYRPALLFAERRAKPLQTRGDRVTLALQAAYAAGKATAAFDRAHLEGLRSELAGIEWEACRLRGRLANISRAIPTDDGWHH